MADENRNFRSWIDDNYRVIRTSGFVIAAGLFGIAMHKTGYFTRVQSPTKQLWTTDFGRRKLWCELYGVQKGTEKAPPCLMMIHQPILRRNISREEVAIAESKNSLCVRVFGVSIDDESSKEMEMFQQNCIDRKQKFLVSPLYVDSSERIVADVSYIGPSYRYCRNKDGKGEGEIDGSVQNEVTQKFHDFLTKSRVKLKHSLLGRFWWHRDLGKELLLANFASIDVDAVDEYVKERGKPDFRWKYVAELEGVEEEARWLKR
eukprot:g4343.t1